MKYFTKFATLVVIALLASLQSCNKQSVLNIENFTEKATVSGVISIMSYTKDGIDKLPAEGKTVVVEVDKSFYCKNAVGVEKFYTVTDEYGNFSIEVPVAKDGVTATVYAESFVLDSTMTVTDIDRLYDYDVENAVFTDVQKTSYSLHAADHYFYNGLLSFTSFDCTFNDKVIDVVLRGKLEYLGYEASTTGVYTTYQPCNGVTFDIKLTRYLNGSEYDTRIYKGVTKSDGFFELNVQMPINDYCDYIFELSVNHLADNFEHHYYNNSTAQWKTQIVQAYFYTKSPFQLEVFNTTLAITHCVDFDIYKVGTRPFDKEIVRGIGNPDVDVDDKGNIIYSQGTLIGWKY